MRYVPSSECSAVYGGVEYLFSNLGMLLAGESEANFISA
jgi:hypothetical protein